VWLQTCQWHVAALPTYLPTNVAHVQGLEMVPGRKLGWQASWRDIETSSCAELQQISHMGTTSLFVLLSLYCSGMFVLPVNIVF
jgi:hypothetical protein